MDFKGVIYGFNSYIGVCIFLKPILVQRYQNYISFIFQKFLGGFKGFEGDVRGFQGFLKGEIHIYIHQDPPLKFVKVHSNQLNTILIGSVLLSLLDDDISGEYWVSCSSLSVSGLRES